MNYTLDMIHSFAVKFTYRVMSLIPGITEVELQNFLKAEVDKQNGVTNADAQADVPFKLFGITFKNIGTAVKTGIIVVVVILGIMAYKKYKRR